MKMRKSTRWILSVLVVLLAGGVSLGLWTWWTLRYRYRDSIYADVESVPSRPVAVVFGAGYWPNGTLSNILLDRVETAVRLYETGKVEKLLFSGDNRVVEYNEPAKMLEYALSRGVPREDIVLDYAGRRTYDTCYRAKEIFQVQEVILVTQRYHLPRALLTCRGLGMDAIGVKADRLAYIRIFWYWVREIPALWQAWFDVHIGHPLPVLGDPLPIFP